MVLPRAHSSNSLVATLHLRSADQQLPPPPPPPFARLPRPQQRRFPINATERPTATAIMDFAAAASTEAFRMALQYIKALFVQEQYRKCIQVCHDALKIAGTGSQNPLQRTYISLYLALSYDAIARVMHHNSVAKIPAFDSAEQHFYEALGGLPSSEQARELCTRVSRSQELDHFVEQAREARKRYSMLSEMSERRSLERSPSRASSLWLSSPPQRDGEHIPSSPTLTASEFDEVESRGSFDLATKGQPREYSRRSLLNSSPPDQRRSMAPVKACPVQRQKSVRGLMRPIRPGSPVKKFHIPLILPYSRSETQLKSTLPRLSTAEQTSARPTSSYLAYATTQSPDERQPVSPVSPVSRAGSDSHSWDTPVSPLSPLTPYYQTTPFQQATPCQQPQWSHQPQWPAYAEPVRPPSIVEAEPVRPPSIVEAEPVRPPSIVEAEPVRPPSIVEAEPARPSSIVEEEPEDSLDEAAFLRVTDHVNALRRQIESHLAMLYNTKEQLYQLQSEKRASNEARLGAEMPHASRDSGKYFYNSPASSRSQSPENKTLQKTKSYWSFVPEDVKAVEKTRRIEEGRARKWQRKRFDPTKYQELAERALAEL